MNNLQLDYASSMLSFFTDLLSSVAQLLMSPPYVYFTACFLGIAVVGIIRKIIN